MKIISLLCLLLLTSCQMGTQTHERPCFGFIEGNTVYTASNKQMHSGVEWVSGLCTDEYFKYVYPL